MSLNKFYDILHMSEHFKNSMFCVVQHFWDNNNHIELRVCDKKTETVIFLSNGLTIPLKVVVIEPFSSSVCKYLVNQKLPIKWTELAYTKPSDVGDSYMKLNLRLSQCKKWNNVLRSCRPKYIVPPRIYTVDIHNGAVKSRRKVSGIFYRSYHRRI